jgi:serine/threonine protein kinase/tetratricopeptide (TPR) repeat protein
VNPSRDDGNPNASNSRGNSAPATPTVDSDERECEVVSAPHPEPKRGTRASELEASAGGSVTQNSDVPFDRAAASGRYLLTAFHARGGMGEIWRCQDATIGREVALKRLVSDRPAARQRFLAEAQITGQLEHPGIVPIHDVGYDDTGKPFYIMKLVRGRTLKTAVDEYHAAPTTNAAEPRELKRVRLLNIFLDICHAAAYAHSRGVIHRDLKPENVMLGPYGETVLLDWGVAKVKGQPEPPDSGGYGSVAPHLSGGTAQTEDGSILGSPLYMPPEMAEGHTTDTDQRTDVYLLGATLYEILTGCPPRRGATRDEILEMARTAPPVPPRKLCKQVPRSLEAICLKAMSRGREHRYASAMDLADDVQRFLANEPVSACNEWWVVRAWRWMKRHRRPIARASVAGIVVALVLAVSILYRESEAARAREAARMQVKHVTELSDEARFYAANIDRPSERVPYYNPTRGRRAAEEALAIADAWGPRLEQLPLAEQREPLRRQLGELSLLLARLRLSMSPQQTPADVAPLLDRADVLLGVQTLASRHMRGNGAGDADQTSPATAGDLFLEAEEARLETARSSAAMPLNEAAARSRRADALARALAGYQAVLRADPGHYWARLQVGRCDLALGRGAEAVEALGACVALRPDAPWGYSVRGLALAMLRRLDEAEADIDRALAIDPHCLPARMNRGVLRVIQNRPGDAAAEFDTLIAVQAPPPEAIYYRAQLFLSAGDATRAGASADRLLRDDPKFAPARLLRAKIRLMLAQTREASEDIDAYLAAEPAITPAVDPRVVRGHLLRHIAPELPKSTRRAALELAAAELSAAIGDNNPTTPPEAHGDLAAVLQLQGRMSAAFESYTRAIALEPANAQLHVNRGWTLDAANRLADAEVDFRKALQLAPDHAEAMTGLAYELARQGQRDEAQQRASAALLADPKDYRILHNVACVYAALSTSDSTRATTHQDAAIRLLERAITAWRGGWGGPDEVELIREESAFPESMRQRQDFKRLLQPSQSTSGV